MSTSLLPLDCSLPGSSVYGDASDKNTRVGCHALLQGIFPTLGLNPVLPHCRQILYHLIHQGSPSVSCSCSNSTFLDRISLVTHQPPLHYIFLGNHQYLFSFIGLLITKHLKGGGLPHRNVLSLTFRDQQCELKVSSALFLSESSEGNCSNVSLRLLIAGNPHYSLSYRCITPVICHNLHVVFLYVSLCPRYTLLMRTPVIMDQGPSLWVLSQLDICKGSISIQGHIHKYQRLGFQHVFQGHDIQQ